MRVRRVPNQAGGQVSFELLNDADQPIPIVTGFLQHLAARGYSPNTLSAYAHDLQHFLRFLAQQDLGYSEFRPSHALLLVEYLRGLPSRNHVQRLAPVLCTTAGPSGTRLSAPSVNRILAAVSSFYEYLILSEQLPSSENPIQQTDDPARARVAERHRPALGQASRQRPIHRVVRVRTVQRVPRPLSEEQVSQLLGALHRWRDRAMLLLMLHGGLRPGDVLNLHLEDIQYGRRRVIVRYRTDHPKGARTKSRQERVVDLHEAEALAAVSTYVMEERPREADSTWSSWSAGAGRSGVSP